MIQVAPIASIGEKMFQRPRRVSAAEDHQLQVLAGRRRSSLTGAGSGGQMNDRRFVFAFPALNLYEVITAVSAAEARHKLMNSNLAPFYGQAVLLNP